ncbi:MAG: efflux transporter outer membrane subunit [Burkholderiaceae bacterium]|nr:efflux transporter outer membrane subunit [Burkholderiaceae bacterium]
MINRRIPLALMLLLSGCASMAPSYERPQAPVPKDWPIKIEPSSQPASRDWRDFFPDRRLQAMIATALEHNRDMRIAVARVEEARSVYGVQRADQLPNVSLNASQSALSLPSNVTLRNQAVTRRFDVNVGLLAFELDFWGRVASLSAAAKANYLASEEAQRAFQLGLIADVADAYLALKEAEERAVLAKATLEGRQETLKLVTRRREAGLASELDVLGAEGLREVARAELAALERQRGQAENFLRVLIGKDGPDWPEGRSLADQNFMPVVVAGVPADVLIRRPDIIAAEQRLMAANANIGAARAAFFPRVSLTASGGTASPELSGLFDSGSGAWSFTPSLSLPIFSGGRNVANLDLAQARKIMAVTEYEKTIQQAFREVADALIARAQISEQLAALIGLEKTQQQRRTLAEARYKAGISSFLEVLDAQRDEFNAQQSVIAARRALLSTMARLYKALGGDQSG